jgi:hypothetical protein
MPAAVLIPEVNFDFQTAALLTGSSPADRADWGQPGQAMRRECPAGTALAPMEMKLVLATILPRWRLTLEDPGGADVRYGTLVGPPAGLQVGFEEG